MPHATSSTARFRKLIRSVNLYPPFLGMGIRMKSHGDDFTRFETDLTDASGLAVAHVVKDVHVRVKR